MMALTNSNKENKQLGGETSNVSKEANIMQNETDKSVHQRKEKESEKGTKRWVNIAKSITIHKSIFKFEYIEQTVKDVRILSNPPLSVIAKGEERTWHALVRYFMEKRKLRLPSFQVEVVLLDYDGIVPTTSNAGNAARKSNENLGTNTTPVDEGASRLTQNKDSKAQDKTNVF